MTEYVDEVANDDEMEECRICGASMLYWQLNNHIVSFHANIEKWDYMAGDTYVNVCSSCAQIIIGNYDLKQVDWKHWTGQDDGTDIEQDLWQPFKQALKPFRCAPCWERNH